MELSDPCFGKIALHVLEFSKTDRKAHIGLLSGLYASSLGKHQSDIRIFLGIKQLNIKIRPVRF